MHLCDYRKNFFLTLVIFVVLDTVRLFPGNGTQEDYDWRFFYQQGTEHYGNLRYQTALEYFQRAENLIKSGRILTTKNEKYQSFEFYMIFKAMGDCFANINAIPKAVAYYRNSLQLKEQQPRLFLYLANYYLYRKQYRQAEKYFEKFYLHKKKNLAVNLQYALILAQQKKLLQSKEKLLAMKASELLNLKENECVSFEEQSKFTKARSCYSSLLFLNPLNKKYYYALIRIANYHQSDYFIPLKEIDRYQKIDHSKSFSFNPNQINHVNSYKRFFAKCLYFFFNDNIKDRWPYYFSFYKAKRFRVAQNTLLEIIKDFPKSSFAILQMAQLKREQNKLNESKKWFEKYKKMLNN